MSPKGHDRKDDGRSLPTYRRVSQRLTRLGTTKLRSSFSNPQPQSSRKRKRCSLLDAELVNSPRRKSVHSLYKRLLFLPYDIFTVILEHCDPGDMLALTKTCTQLKNHIGPVYLRASGILQVKEDALNIRFLGGPFSPWTAFLLGQFGSITPDFIHTTTVMVDLFHLAYFFLDIAALMKNLVAASFELEVAQDEHYLLTNRLLSGSLMDILAHLVDPWSRISISWATKPDSPSTQTRHLRHAPPLFYGTTDQLTVQSHFTPKVLVISSTVTGFAALAPAVWLLLRHPTVEVLAIHSRSGSEVVRVLKRVRLAALESLSVKVADGTVATLPDQFIKQHSQLHSVFLTTLCPWGLPNAFTDSDAQITLPSVSCATISSKYAGFIITNPSQLQELHIASFMSLPLPDNLCFCTVVQSLTDVWLHSTFFVPIPSFCASFTFPLGLHCHLDHFLSQTHGEKCRCTLPPSVGVAESLNWVANVRVHVDNLTANVMEYLSIWICRFQGLKDLEIRTMSLNPDHKGFQVSISDFQKRVNGLQGVRYGRDGSSALLQL